MRARVRVVSPFNLKVTVVIVKTPFAPFKMNVFVGCMDVESVSYTIIRDVLLVLDLLLRQNICQSVFVKVHISNIIEGSGSVAVSCSAA